MAERDVRAQQDREFWTDELWADGGLVLDPVERKLLFVGEDLMPTMNERRAMLDVLPVLWPGYSIAWASDATAEIAAYVHRIFRCATNLLSLSCFWPRTPRTYTTSQPSSVRTEYFERGRCGGAVGPPGTARNSSTRGPAPTTLLWSWASCPKAATMWTYPASYADSPAGTLRSLAETLGAAEADLDGDMAVFRTGERPTPQEWANSRTPARNCVWGRRRLDELASSFWATMGGQVLRECQCPAIRSAPSDTANPKELE